MNKLLVVEDDTLLSNMIKGVLILNNYDVSTAYSGSEALLLLEKDSFDLILLDLMLPEQKMENESSL
ncbi:response regulator transcription factor [Desemzia sp. RIT 804]|uniref:response regulator transcription factor n=1 Tax=Desemzia sp. RIT 804 TaxID=2810209 RepID=UPI00351C6906